MGVSTGFTCEHMLWGVLGMGIPFQAQTRSAAVCQHAEGEPAPACGKCAVSQCLPTSQGVRRAGLEHGCMCRSEKGTRSPALPRELALSPRESVPREGPTSQSEV